MRVVKGMVQVADGTYRIVRLAQGSYEVVRILDDARVGTFTSVPTIQVTSSHVDPALMALIARAAIHGAKTSWVGRLTPD